MLYQIIIEIFSAIFRIEGIQIDKAKFQTISILTGTGFTTSESELMLSTKRRRKLTQIMILCSYIFNITIVTTIVIVFISSSNTSVTEFVIGIILTILNIALLLLNKSTKIRRFFDDIIQNISIRSGEKRPNPISVYNYYNNKVIAEVRIVKINNEINGLNSNILKEKYEIQLLVVKRENEIITDILPNLCIESGDVLLLFDNLKKIKSVFKLRKDNKK